MTSELKKPGRVNTIIRLIGLTFIIIGILTVYIAYLSVSFLGSYQSLFIIVGMSVFILGFLSFTVRIE